MARQRLRGRKLVRRWRDAQEPSVTQEALGDAVGVSGSYIRHFELGNRDLPLEVRIRLSRHTGIDLEDFLGPHEKALVLESRDRAEGAA